MSIVKYQWVRAAGLLWVVLAAESASAQATLEFTLDEVEHAEKGVALPDPEAGETAPVAVVVAEPELQPGVTEALGALRWGMNRAQLLAVVKDRLRAEYVARIKAEHDIVRQDLLYQEANETFRRIKDGFIVFNGRKTGWDASPVAEEFRHGSDESLLLVDGAEARDHYFFMKGKLWKWYRELKPAAYGRVELDAVSKLLSQRFGKGRAGDQSRDQGGIAYPSVSWAQAGTRVTVFRRGTETCLVFEDEATLAQLAVLREHAQPRGRNESSLIDGVLMTAEERERFRSREDAAPAVVTRVRKANRVLSTPAPREVAAR